MSPAPVRLTRRSSTASRVSQFGSLLPARIPASTGSVIDIPNLSTLQSSLSGAALGSILDLGGRTINLAGDTAFWDRNGDSTHVTTLRNGIIYGGGANGCLRVMGSYFRAQNLEIYGATSQDNIKLTYSGGQTAHHIDIDKCYIHNARKQGLLVNGDQASLNPYAWQVWDTWFDSNGFSGQYDHNVYISDNDDTRTGDLRSVFANCLFTNAAAYNMQLYPHCKGLIVTCCTLDGGQMTSNDPLNQGYGGLVLGSEAGDSDNNIMVGLIVSNAPNSAGFHVWDPAGTCTNNKVLDAISYNNSGGTHETGAGMAYTPTPVNSNPLYVNRAGNNFHLQGGSPAINKIQVANYGYVPPLDRDGNPRITADAGCYRA